jgi:hypothetical protein
MPAFLVTWSSGKNGWPHSRLVALISEFYRAGYAETRWRFAACKMAKIGDRVWALRQGSSPRAVFGVGRIAGSPVIENENGKPVRRIPIRFEALVDPLQDSIVSEDDVKNILSKNQINTQMSGIPLDSDGAQTELLESRYALAIKRLGPSSIEGS